ncbi:MAG: M60 family metallopeptidase [Bacteroidales bacterium]|jgi:hypothetical protein|nr:M60 family metallopeptidase [Bacteroidales bacterium]
MKKLFLLSLLFLFWNGTRLMAEITTPYPETIVLKQINSAEKECLRLAQGHNKFDRQPTGFYIEAGKTMAVNVETLTPAADGAKPILIVGTLGFNVDNRARTEFPLEEGVNRITPQHGGLVYLGFVSGNPSQPVGEVKVTFTPESEQVRAPRYVYGTTGDAEFAEMMEAYQTPDVIFHSDYAVVCATREAATAHSLGQKKDEWMGGLHTLLEKEDEISGMDNNDPNPVHHRLKAGEVRYLLVENTSTSPHANSVGYTGYPHSSVNRYLTVFGSSNNSWMLGHELGHQHQQPAYMIRQATESTVNIYAYAVERNIQGSYNRTTAARWKQAQDTYLNIPVSKRIYDMEDSDLEAITGFNRDELRFMMWEQFFLVFGDEFYKTLHRVVREEKITGGGAEERRAYLIWKASQVTGYDLTDFFNLWGVRVTDAGLKDQLRARMYTALTHGTIIPLPRPATDLVMVTGQQAPDWAPLPLRGITSSAPQNDGLDRSAWTVITSFAGVPDATIGGDKPVYIIDGSQTTAFSFIKPGKSYEGVTGPSDYIPSFTIDMKEKQEFNYFVYRHRTANNNSEFIRAREISFYGKNTEEGDFVPIVENVAIDHTENRDEIKVVFGKVEYRYVQLVINDWNQSSGSSIQVSEFNAGVENPEELLTPDPYQYTVTVEASEGIVTSTGEFKADEASEFSVEFTLLPAYGNLTVIVDGDDYEPVLSGGVYTVKQRITNHTAISIKASVKVYAVKINRGEGVTLVAPEAGEVNYGDDFRAGFTLAAGYGNPTITGGEAVIEGNTIRIPSIMANVEITISASKVTGIADYLDEPPVRIYPNPVTSGQTLTIDASGMAKEKAVLEICGADGRVLEQKIINGGVMKITMNRAPGIYFLKIAAGKETVYKIIVQ